MADGKTRPLGRAGAEGAQAPDPSSRQARFGELAPKLVELADDLIFGDIWERPELSKRDRSMVTVAALVAMGQTEQLPFHFNKAVENGLSKTELVEVITHLAFYSGFPSAMSALTVAKQFFQSGE